MHMSNKHRSSAPITLDLTATDPIVRWPLSVALTSLLPCAIMWYTWSE